MKISWTKMVGLGGLCFGSLASAQMCQINNSNIFGSYVYVANQPTVISTTGSGTTGTGGTGTSNTGFSTTTLGMLLSGIASGNQFADSGTIYFDGAGNIDAAPSPGGTLMAVGTYTINADCSISVSLTDAFGTVTTPVKLVGVILGGGAEIDLTSALNSTGTSGTGTTSGTTVQFGSGPVIKLTKVGNRTGCSTGNLQGLYGFVLNTMPVQNSTSGTGTGTGTGTTTTTNLPSTQIGYITFNGAGGITANPAIPATTTTVTPTSLQPELQFTGTYTVNSDCSGTMTIASGPTSTTSGTSTTRSFTINFFEVSAGGTPFNPLPQLSGLALSVSNSNTVGWGYASQQ
jgi:hypothetical protein